MHLKQHQFSNEHFEVQYWAGWLLQASCRTFSSADVNYLVCLSVIVLHLISD